MSIAGVKIVRLAAELANALPGWSNSQRADMAARILESDRNAVQIDGEGNAYFSAAARALVPSLPTTTDPRRQGRIGPVGAAPEPPQGRPLFRTPELSAEEVANNEAKEAKLTDLRAQLASIKGDDEASHIARAHLYESIVWTTGEYSSSPEKP